MLDKDFQIVRRTLIFDGLSEDLLRRLLRQGGAVDQPRGETLFRQGEPADHFYVVLDGWVKVYRVTRAGDEAILGIFTRGQGFAEAAAFAEGQYPASAETVTECRLLRMSSAGIIAGIRESPDIALAMLAATSRHLHALVQQIEQLKARTGIQRVAEFLAELCPVEQGACTIGLPYDKALIAGRLGMKPESLSRAFARLRPLGVVIDHNTAAISDVAALRGVIDEEPGVFDGSVRLG